MACIATLNRKFAFKPRPSTQPVTPIKSIYGSSDYTMVICLPMTFRCSTYNCLSSGVCGKAPEAPNQFGTWVYIVVAVGIFGGVKIFLCSGDRADLCSGIFGTLTALFIVHRRQRDNEREKRMQYWREQVRLFPPSYSFHMLNRFPECIPPEYHEHETECARQHPVHAPEWQFKQPQQHHVQYVRGLASANDGARCYQSQWFTSTILRR
jgi:hypothetical protein